MNEKKNLISFLGKGEIVSAPFYIVAPPVAQCEEASIFLYDLCRLLNAIGERAFILHYPLNSQPIRHLPHYALFQQLSETPDNLYVPLVTQEIFDFYDNKKIMPVVIYDGSIDNPLNAQFFGIFFASSNVHVKSAAAQPPNFILSNNVAAAQRLAEGIGCVSVALDTPLSNVRNIWLAGADGLREQLGTLADKLKKMAAAVGYSGSINYPYQPRMVLFHADKNLISPQEITFSPRKGDNLLENAELPYVVLPSSVIGDIAREVMFEQQRWSWRYKIKEHLSKYMVFIFSLFKS